jgi:predicted lipopolysaccharide heptosyltransferase III
LNVLLIQLKRIGDLILTVPAIAAVRTHFPNANLTLVVAHGSREMLPAIPDVDRALIARGRVTDAPQWFALATAKFDYCLDFSRTDRSAFLTLLSNATKRITYRTIRREPLRRLSYNEFVPSRVRDLHTIDHHLALLEPLGIHDAWDKIHLNLPDSAKDQADRAIAAHHLGENFAVIHPGSARIEKFWIAERWVLVAEQLRRRGMQVVLTGGKSRLEQDHLADIKSHLQGTIVDLSGKLGLLAVAALIERARILATVDSAPMHLAAALGIPQVVLFGPTNPFHWRPRGAPAVVLRAGQEQPMTSFVPKQTPHPMKEISTKQVIDGMESLLSAPAARAS